MCSVLLGLVNIALRVERFSWQRHTPSDDQEYDTYTDGMEDGGEEGDEDGGESPVFGFGRGSKPPAEDLSSSDSDAEDHKARNKGARHSVR